MKRTTVDQEYFGVTKVMWAKCSMNFNFVNLAGIQNLFNFGYFITKGFPHYIHVYSDRNGDGSSTHGYDVYKDLLEKIILIMKIDMLWL